MQPSIEIVIYAYLFICASLLLFNVWYIFRRKQRARRTEQQTQIWSLAIDLQLRRLSEGLELEPDRLKRMEKLLTRIDQLTSFGAALDRLKRKNPMLSHRYAQAVQSSLQLLASHYAQRDSMERAYFSYLISQHRPCFGEEYRPLMEILLSFFDNSTVYCRENVLKALYALGNCQAVENALQILNDRQLFHHPKLLSDGLLTFTGDKQALAARLWSHSRSWDAGILLAVVQFITGFTAGYQDVFLPVLRAEDTDAELRLAILRYYRRHVYEPVRPLLLSYLLEPGTQENIRIVTATVLARYPGAETVEALKQALHHPNWYVRYNAAASLVELKASRQELQEVFAGEDRYAKEILEYMLEDAKAGADDD